MNSAELLERLKHFAYRIVTVTKSLPHTPEANIIQGQILRSAFSAAANYRSACKAYSKKSFSAKMGISLEEMDESVFWLEVIIDLRIIEIKKLDSLLQEGNELCKILAKSVITSGRETQK